MVEQQECDLDFIDRLIEAGKELTAQRIHATVSPGTATVVWDDKFVDSLRIPESAIPDRMAADHRNITESPETQSRVRYGKLGVRVSPDALAASAEQFAMDSFPESTAALVVRDANKLVAAVAAMLIRSPHRIEQFFVSCVADIIAHNDSGMLAAAGMELSLGVNVDEYIDALGEDDNEDE